MSEFPRVLYKPGASEDAHGFQVDLHYVDDAEALEAAKAEGWALTPAEAYADPLDHDADGKKGGSKPRKTKAEKEAEELAKLETELAALETKDGE